MTKLFLPLKIFQKMGLVFFLKGVKNKLNNKIKTIKKKGGKIVYEKINGNHVTVFPGRRM